MVATRPIAFRVPEAEFDRLVSLAESWEMTTSELMRVTAQDLGVRYIPTGNLLSSCKRAVNTQEAVEAKKTVLPPTSCDRPIRKRYRRLKKL